MSPGGVEFTVFYRPLDANVEARVNSEYLWGRHFIFSLPSLRTHHRKSVLTNLRSNRKLPK